MMYYECHVTIEPVFDERREALASLADRFFFKLADLLMKKRKADTEERSDKDSFLTSTHVDYNLLLVRMEHLIKALKQEDYKVHRYKIEYVMLDSRSDDELGLLS